MSENIAMPELYNIEYEVLSDNNHKYTVNQHEWGVVDRKKQFVQLIQQINRESAKCSNPAKFHTRRRDALLHFWQEERRVQNYRSKNVAFFRDLNQQQEAILPPLEPFEGTEYYGEDLALREIGDSQFIEFIDDEMIVDSMKKLDDALLARGLATPIRAIGYVGASSSVNMLAYEAAHLANPVIGLASFAVGGLSFAVHTRRVSKAQQSLTDIVERGQPDTMKLAKDAHLLPKKYKTNFEFLRAQFAAAKDPGELWSAIKPLAWELAEFEYRFVTGHTENELLDTVPSPAEVLLAQERTKEIRKQIFEIASDF